MKQVLFIAAIILQSVFINAQSYHGIKVGQGIEATKAAVLAKGFKFIKKNTDNSYTYQKKIDGRIVTLHIVCTPYSKIVRKMLVYVDENTSWFDSKRSYVNMVEILTSKYGEPSSTLVNWESPYYEGDGYEIQAMYFDKCTLLTFFNDSEGNYITLDLDAFTIGKSTLMIHYENKKAQEIKDRETNRVNQQMY